MLETAECADNSSVLSQNADLAKVHVIRARLFKHYRNHPDIYDTRDIQYLTDNDRLISLALYCQHHDENSSFTLMDEVLQWRKGFGVPRLQWSDFPTELFDFGASAIIGKDKGGYQVIWFRIKGELLIILLLS